MVEPASWREELAVSHAGIDRQHREMIAKAGELQVAISSGASEAEAQRILTSLVEITRAHFVFEEGLMLASGYPRFDSHRQEHAKLLDQLQQVRDQLAVGQVDASELLAALVRTITEQHIRFADQQLAKYLLDCGFE